LRIVIHPEVHEEDTRLLDQHMAVPSRDLDRVLFKLRRGYVRLVLSKQGQL
jgi:hypothetical protein